MPFPAFGETCIAKEGFSLLVFGWPCHNLAAFFSRFTYEKQSSTQVDQNSLSPLQHGIGKNKMPFKIVISKSSIESEALVFYPYLFQHE
ncbi:hypothetical protein FMM05_20080 [Flavobacterium zepuense]|uniref:Uncharacterized protein n=1 Tax=Flavobacterium zepuense TaxID=2593302 RepID=A0A552UTL7_9FLAO|nr:hypothetical protein [Flavobacterium zepuense]TRW21558.1 hypothetical protein FMM05_20080 [Flavobacterium zepuense]